jgi:hypothetical protein
MELDLADAPSSSPAPAAGSASRSRGAGRRGRAGGICSRDEAAVAAAAAQLGDGATGLAADVRDDAAVAAFVPTRRPRSGAWTPSSTTPGASAAARSSS